jgi:hypothetical protein
MAKKPLNEGITRGHVKLGVTKPRPTESVLKPKAPPPPPKKKN